MTQVSTCNVTLNTQVSSGGNDLWLEDFLSQYRISGSVGVKNRILDRVIYLFLVKVTDQLITTVGNKCSRFLDSLLLTFTHQPISTEKRDTKSSSYLLLRRTTLSLVSSPNLSTNTLVHPCAGYLLVFKSRFIIPFSALFSDKNCTWHDNYRNA